MKEKESSNNNNTIGGKYFLLPGNYFSDFTLRISEKFHSRSEAFYFPYLQNTVLQNDGEKELLDEDCTISSKWKENSPFEIPEPNYFKIQFQKLENSKNVFDELVSYTLLRENFKVGSGYHVPESYFEGFSINKPVKKEVSNRSFIDFLRFIFRPVHFVGFAAVVILFFFWFSNNFTSLDSERDCNSIACLSQDEVWLQMEKLELSNDEVSDLLNEKELNQYLTTHWVNSSDELLLEMSENEIVNDL